jgi:hypothetical protein
MLVCEMTRYLLILPFVRCEIWQYIILGAILSVQISRGSMMDLTLQAKVIGKTRAACYYFLGGSFQASSC